MLRRPIETTALIRDLEPIISVMGPLAHIPTAAYALESANSDLGSENHGGSGYQRPHRVDTRTKSTAKPGPVAVRRLRRKLGR